MTDTLILGTSFAVFFGITVVLMGSCAFLTGWTLARTWRPARYVLPYALLLAFAGRFLIYALFDGNPRAVWGFVIDLYVILLVALLTYRLTLVKQMVRQYPWLYDQFLIFGLRKRRPVNATDLDEFGLEQAE